MSFNEIKIKFEEERSKEDGFKVMEKAAEIVNDIGASFTELDGGILAEYQSKLAGYKFYLADYMAELNREYERLDLDTKHIRATNWDKITEEIKAKEGKVKNKEQIENAMIELTEDLKYESMLYETMYYKYKLKISSMDSILMALNQRLAELRKQFGQ